MGCVIQAISTGGATGGGGKTSEFFPEPVWQKEVGLNNEAWQGAAGTCMMLNTWAWSAFTNVLSEVYTNP